MCCSEVQHAVVRSRCLVPLGPEPGSEALWEVKEVGDRGLNVMGRGVRPGSPVDG